jgi:hypothetical protein
MGNKQRFLFKSSEITIDSNSESYQVFLRNIKTSLYLVLLEKGEITKWQYEQALRKIKIAEGGML